MTKFYKAVREDYMDFATGTIKYEVGTTVVHPNPGTFGRGDADGYLSVTTDPTLCIGAIWPVRVLEVEADDYWQPHIIDTYDYAQKRAVHKLKVVREIEPWRFFGPQGEKVVELHEKMSQIAKVQYRKEGLWDALDEIRSKAYEQGYAYERGPRGYRFESLGGQRRQAINASHGGMLYHVMPYLIISDLLDPKKDDDVIKWVNDTIEEFEALHYKFTTPWYKKVWDRIMKGENK